MPTKIAQTPAVRAPAWVLNVDEPDAWALEHRWLLEAIGRRFLGDGAWPRLDDVQRELARIDPRRAVAAAQLVIDMPTALGVRHGEHVRLTVRALSYVTGAASVLAEFVDAMLVAMVLYSSSDDGLSALLSGRAVRHRLKLDDLSYRRVSTLIFDEPWFLGSGSGAVDQDWTREIRVEVLLLQEVTGVAGYLEAVARYRFGPPEVEGVQASDASGVGALLVHAPPRWLAKHETTIGDRIVIAVLTAVIAGVALWLLVGS